MPSLDKSPIPRFEPLPGVYLATLVNLEFVPEGKTSYKFEWMLTNYPETCHEWFAVQWFPAKNVGKLSHSTYRWKGQLWSQLGESTIERFLTARRWIGDTATVRVQALQLRHGEIMVVTEVSPAREAESIPRVPAPEPIASSLT
jgi:hypothetical protein